MQPWKISAGLTAALAGSAVLLAGSRFEYLAPFWSVILADYGLAIAFHLALGLAAVAASIYAVARAAGLSDLGRRVDLAERSVRRGEGDPELARALTQGRRGRLGLTAKTSLASRLNIWRAPFPPSRLPYVTWATRRPGL